MQFREYPLLNTPNLITVILRAAADGASVEDCASRLGALLASAGERPAVTAEEILRRLELLRRDLTEARLLTPPEAGRFALTERGRAALVEHPGGFARADLMIYPEYAEYVRRCARQAGRPDDPGAAGYDAGYSAFMAGEGLADNPNPPDTQDHLAWENGWSEALDEKGH